MLLGDPFEFAVLFKTVDEWSNNVYKNGILMIFVDGYMFPNKELINVTLNCSAGIPLLKESLENVPVDNELYNMPAKKLYKRLHKLVYPEPDSSITGDHRYLITPTEIADKGFDIVAVGSGEKIRILAARPIYQKRTSQSLFDRLVIRETYVDTAKINKIIDGLALWLAENTKQKERDK